MAAAAGYEVELGIPVTDPLWGSPEMLVSMVTDAYPALLMREIRPVA
jgi:hypothetical protein